MRERSLAFLLIATTSLLLLAASSAGAATNGKIKGSFAGAAIPKGARGNVRAVDLRTFTVTAFSPTSSKGAFTLSVPAGHYAVIGSIAAKKRVTQPAYALARIAGGKTLRVAVPTSAVRKKLRKCSKLKGKKRAKCVKKARAPAKARRSSTSVRASAVAQDGLPNVGVEPFTGGTLAPAFSDALIGKLHSLYGANSSKAIRPCLDVIEVEHAAELQKEIERSQDPGFDPKFKLDRGALQSSQFVVRGTARQVGSRMEYSVSVVDAATGGVLSTTAGSTTGGAGSAFFDSWEAATTDLAKRIADETCRKPKYYVGTVSGGYSANEPGVRVSNEQWTVSNVRYERVAGSSPVRYQLGGGAATFASTVRSWIYSGTVECVATAQGSSGAVAASTFEAIEFGLVNNDKYRITGGFEVPTTEQETCGGTALPPTQDDGTGRWESDLLGGSETSWLNSRSLVGRLSGSVTRPVLGSADTPIGAATATWDLQPGW